MKILILRFSSIGDIVLTTPVMRCIKNAKPQAEIHYATKSQYAGLLKHNPYVDKVHTLEGSLSPLIQILRKEEFDLIIDLHHNLRTWRIKWALGVKYSSFRKLNFRKWLLVRFKINKMPDRHIVHRYLDACAPLRISYDGKGLDFFPNPATVLPEGLLPPADFLVYAIGGTWQTKKMPVHKIAELAGKINFPLLLIGDKSDAHSASELAARCANVVNCCGTLSIDQSATLMARATAVITHDTGMMHIAAALNKQIISIWGNTVPEFGMYPFFPDNSRPQISAMVQVEGLSCRPCSKIGFEKCPKGHFKCMELQDTDKISRFLPV